MSVDSQDMIFPAEAKVFNLLAGELKKLPGTLTFAVPSHATDGAEIKVLTQSIALSGRPNSIATTSIEGAIEIEQCINRRAQWSLVQWHNNNIGGNFSNPGVISL